MRACIQPRLMQINFIFGLFVGTFLSSTIILFSADSIYFTRQPVTKTNEDTTQSIAETTKNKKDEITQKSDQIQYFLKDNYHVADILYRNVKVLCYILTAKGNHDKKAKHVKSTWAKRCNKALFMSTEPNDDLPVVFLNVSHGRDTLWGKTKLAFTHIYENYFNEYDWFMKADDDSYIIMENLRLFLTTQNTSLPIWHGLRYKPYTPYGYYAGGSGYILSKEALRRLYTEIKNTTKCKKDDKGSEDVNIGRCMHFLDVRPGDTRDMFGSYRFMSMSPDFILGSQSRDASFWFWKYVWYPIKEGFDCCSNFTVSFHYVSPKQMYVLDFLIYHLRPFGVQQSYTIDARNNELQDNAIFEEIKHISMQWQSKDFSYEGTQPPPPKVTARPVKAIDKTKNTTEKEDTQKNDTTIANNNTKSINVKDDR